MRTVKDGMGTRKLLLLAVAALGACDSEVVTRFKDHAATMCSCSDSSCAKGVHKNFVADWNEMKSADIDWTSDDGKRDSKKIEDAVKDYRKCLDEQVTASEATDVCQEDKDAQKHTEGCMQCCVEQGRFFRSWVDPMAAGFADALGAGEIKGCSCS